MLNQINILNAKDIYLKIYSLLWDKSINQNRVNFEFRISDTIIFLDGHPISWVFTSKKDGTLKKRSYSNLKNSEIIRKFCSFDQKIVAYYMYNSVDNMDIESNNNYEGEKTDELNLIEEYLSQMGINSEEKLSQKKEKILFDFFEKQELIDFINKGKKRSGVLQLFKEANDPYNCMFRINYTPEKSFCDFRKARKPFLSKNIHNFEKLVTFETNKFNITTEHIKSQVVSKKLEDYAKTICQHLESIFKNNIRIRSITLHFKESKDKQIYLQFCSGIKFIEFENEQRTISIWKSSMLACDLTEKFLIESHKNIYKNSDSKGMKRVNCVHCSKPIPIGKSNKIACDQILKFNRYLRSLPTIEQIKIEENDILNYVNPILVLDHVTHVEGKHSQGVTELKIGLMRTAKSDIPMAIQRIHPKLEIDKFKKIVDDSYLKDMKVNVCDDCFINLNHIFTMTKADLNAKILQNHYKKVIFGKEFEDRQQQQISTEPNKQLNNIEELDELDPIYFKEKEDFDIWKRESKTSKNNIRTMGKSKTNIYREFTIQKYGSRIKMSRNSIGAKDDESFPHNETHLQSTQTLKKIMPLIRPNTTRNTDDLINKKSDNERLKTSFGNSDRIVSATTNFQTISNQSNFNISKNFTPKNNATLLKFK